MPCHHRPAPWLQRRRVLQSAGAVATLGLAGLPTAKAVAADPSRFITAPSFADAIALLGGAPMPSALVSLQAPAQAEDGAFVPITVASAVRGTHEILILVDSNPQPVAAQFTFAAGTDAFVTTRIRMAGSGTVWALARTEDQLVYGAAQAIVVTVGGCG